MDSQPFDHHFRTVEAPVKDPLLVEFEPKTEFTRREFVVTTLATGFAAAVQPVAASTVITTDAQGLAAGEVKIPVKGGEIAAYRAMPAGGTLTIQAARSGRRLILDVIDSGPSVPESARTHIFEPYLTPDPDRGPDLGLAVARSLLRSHGGDLVYLPRRQGSCFRVVIKAAGGRAA